LDSNRQSYARLEESVGSPIRRNQARIVNTTCSDSGASVMPGRGRTRNLGLPKIQKSKFAKFENLEKWIFANREKSFRRDLVFNFASIEDVC
jgi:hypothetical protein